MTAILASEPATTKAASADALDSKPPIRQPASKHDRSERQSDCPSSDPRVLRVLVVDGDQESADALAELVRHCGHAACAAPVGLAALRVAAAQNSDVVLLDMETPFTDGRLFARQLRLDFPRDECLIIAVSERADEVRRQQSIDAGIDVVLTKPVDPLVVETLLLLECVRVNRRRARGARKKLGARHRVLA